MAAFAYIICMLKAVLVKSVMERVSLFEEKICVSACEPVKLHDAITSDSGWDTVRNKDFLTEICAEFRRNGIRTSIFVGADPAMVEGA